jgi:hypothetical protein
VNTLAGIALWFSGVAFMWSIACRIDERRERLRARLAWLESTDEMQRCLDGMAIQNGQLREQNAILVVLARNREEAVTKRVRGQLRPSAN